MELAKLERQYGKLTNEQIRAQTDALAADVRDILANDLVPAGTKGKKGPPIERDDKAQDERGNPTATTTTPVEPTPQPAPAPQPQPAPAEPPAPPPTETVPPTATTPAPPPAEEPTMTTMTP